MMGGSADNPRVRRNLRYSRQEQDGRVTYIVKDPVTLKYFRFGMVEAWLMERMDGTRSTTQLANELRAEFDMNATPASLDMLARRLNELGLVDRKPNERSVLLMESIRRDRRVRLEENRNTLLRMRFSFGDPDVLLGRMVDAMPFFWTPAFVIASAALFAAYALIVVRHWAPFVQGFSALYDPAGFTFGLLLMLYVAGTVIFLIHEMGHGLTCKRFGGEVHEMGAMLFYFSPAFFCNVNDAYTFEKRSHRLWVTFAGGWIQLCIAAVAAIAWVLTEPGTAVNRGAFIATLIAGGLSVLINYNPLIPLDGYYAMVDWLDIPNLRPRSFAYLSSFMRRHVLRLDSPLPAATPRERRIFLIYGSLSFAYTALILSVFFLWAGRIAIHRLGGWGWVLVLVVAFRATGGIRHGLTRTARIFAAEKMPQARYRRAAFLAIAAFALLTGAAFVTPWTIRVPAVAVVEPLSSAALRAPESARLVRVYVGEAGSVRPGDTVAVLRAPALEIEWSGSAAALRTLERERSAAMQNGAAATRMASVRADAERARFNALERRRDALVLRAPFSGIVATSRLDEQIGATIPAGGMVAQLWGRELRARLRIDQRDAGSIAPGTPVGIRFTSFPGVTWRSRIAHVDPAASNDRVDALAGIGAGNTVPLLRPGMTGTARITVMRTDVAAAVARSFRRVIRLDFML